MALQPKKSKTDAQKREAFKRLAVVRTNKALAAIASLGKLANTKAYNYGAADVARIDTALTNAMTDARNALNAALEGKKPVVAGFSLDDKEGGE